MTIQEFINTWEAGQEVTVIEMGGLGKGYEIAIWEYAIKALNYMTNIKPFDWETYNTLAPTDKIENWRGYTKEAEAVDLKETLEYLGLSGSQWGAAWNAASVISKNGLTDALAMVDTTRLIKLSKGGLSLDPKELVKVE
jgi:hypothetical protein